MVTIVNIALPDLVRSLHASFSDLQWVIDAYAAIASMVGRDDLDIDHIVPSVFDEKLVPAVAAAIRDA